MECLTILAVFAAAAALFLTLQARRQRRGLGQRLDTLEADVAQLRRRLQASAATPEAAEAPPPERRAPAAPPAMTAEAPAAAPRTVTPREVPKPPPRPEARPAPPARPLTPPRPPAPPPGPALQIDWEQWLGIRGAAVVGGVLLALAALFFLRIAIEAGWFPPAVRVALGFLAGIVCVGGSGILRSRDYAATADAVAGAGVVTLYGAAWAADVLYQLIPTALAFALMALTTAVCGLLSWRHRSKVIALLGLIGGFATPLLLSTAADDPLGLFGYLLLLNLGLIALARRRSWPGLMPLGLLATFLFQARWILTRLGPDTLILGIGLVALFAVLFAAAGLGRTSPEVRQAASWRLGQIAGVLLPFLFALIFAVRADLGDRLWPLLALLALLSAAAEWSGRAQGAPLWGLAAAAADLGVVVAWWAAQGFDAGWAGSLTTAVVVLALVFHAFDELDRQGRGVHTPSGTPTSWSATVLACGSLLLLAVGPAIAWTAELLLRQGAGAEAPPFWPWLAGWAALAALLLRQGLAPGRGTLGLVAAFGPALGFVLYHTTVRRGTGEPPELLVFGFALLGAVVFHLLALVGRGRREPDARRLADLASAAYPTVLLLGLLAEAAEPKPSALSPSTYLAVTLLAALLAALAAFRLPSGGAYLGAMALTAIGHTLWSSWAIHAPEASRLALAGLGAQLAAVAFFTAGPLIAGRRFAADPWAWRAAALAGPLGFLALHQLFEARFGDRAIGLLPLLLAALTLAVLAFARRQLDDERLQRHAVVWLAAVALSLVAVAIPLQLEKEWITLGWALQALGLIALWRRLDHPGLKYFALALAALVTVRLVVNPSLLTYHPASTLPVLNWLLYTYLVPAAALLTSAALLRPLEVPRQRPAEASLYRAGLPVAATACATAAIVIVFVWINLTIFDAFSTGATVEVSFARQPARDLTLSLAWALYALVLLAVGFARDLRGLRWGGLTFLCLTLAKLFLYDLGELGGLYRVASLVGLAVSLLLVSLAYQRFTRGSAGHDEGDPR